MASAEVCPGCELLELAGEELPKDPTKRRGLRQFLIPRHVAELLERAEDEGEAHDEDG